MIGSGLGSDLGLLQGVKCSSLSRRTDSLLFGEMGVGTDVSVLTHGFTVIQASLKVLILLLLPLKCLAYRCPPPCLARV